MLSAMKYPHWLMVAGAVLVVFGFFGFVFLKNTAEPAEDDNLDAPPEERAQLKSRLTKEPEEFQEVRVDRPRAKGK
jgi:hypothetical protein